MVNNRFYSKILISGEYIIFQRAKALAVPYKNYSGKLDFITDKSIHDKLENHSNKVFQDLNKYFDKTLSGSVLTNKFKLGKFNNDINNGLYFNSNIHEGYGIGSSGALTAAIYNNYVNNREYFFNNEFHNKILLNLKNELAYIESFFHGKSSGIDALVSYVNKPLLINRNSIEVTNYKIEKKPQLTILLIDTGQTRNTQDLINRFNNEIENKKLFKLLENGLIPASNSFTDALIENNIPGIFKNLQKISEFQFDNFRLLIVPEFLNFWEQGLKSGKYFLKLCGSGSGGYLLGLINDFEYFNNVVNLNFPSINYEIVNC